MYFALAQLSNIFLCARQGGNETEEEGDSDELQIGKEIYHFFLSFSRHKSKYPPRRQSREARHIRRKGGNPWQKYAQPRQAADIGTCHIKEVNQYHRISLLRSLNKNEPRSLQVLSNHIAPSFLRVRIYRPTQLLRMSKEREKGGRDHLWERNRRNDKTNVQARITQR